MIPLYIHSFGVASVDGVSTPTLPLSNRQSEDLTYRPCSHDQPLGLTIENMQKKAWNEDMGVAAGEGEREGGREEGMIDGAILTKGIEDNKGEGGEIGDEGSLSPIENTRKGDKEEGEVVSGKDDSNSSVNLAVSAPPPSASTVTPAQSPHFLSQNFPTLWNLVSSTSTSTVSSTPSIPPSPHSTTLDGDANTNAGVTSSLSSASSAFNVSNHPSRQYVGHEDYRYVIYTHIYAYTCMSIYK